MIITFTRVVSDDIDSLIFDEEVLLELVQELGFDSAALQQLSRAPEQADPESLYHLIHQRWSGEGQTFSIENQLHLLQHCCTAASSKVPQVSQILKISRATPTELNDQNIRILFPHQVDEIADELAKLPVEVLQGKASVDELNQSRVLPHLDQWSQEELVTAPLWQIYDGFCQFFQNAANEDAYVFIAHQK